VRRAGRVHSIGKYKRIVELARGGMGVVHLAVVDGPGGFHKLVVVKELAKHLATRPDLVEMFLEEARIAALLNHPNVVQTNEVGSEGSHHFFVMEFLEGPNLRSLLRALERKNGLPLPIHLHILCNALAGLHYAHELKDYSGNPLSIVHRDVSPHNLIVTCEGTTKVVDFGLARANDTLRKTQSGVLRGKIAYLAPEHIQGERVDRRADIFSVGVMLWEALAGKRMWQGLHDFAIAQKLVAGEIPKLREHAPQVSPALEKIVGRALAPKRSERYPTAAELQSDLEAYILASSLQTSARSVGALVSERFKEDRERTHALVEAQLQEMRAKGDKTRIVILDGNEDTTSDSGREGSLGEDDGYDEDDEDEDEPTERFEPPTPASVRTMPRQPPSAAKISARKEGTPSAPESIRAPALRPITLPPESAADHPLDLASAASMVPVSSAGSRAVRQWATQSLAFVGGALATCLLVFFIAKRPWANPHSHGGAARSSVELKVHASPAEARIYLDDQLVGSGSYEGSMVNDGASHVIRLEADGFTPASETVDLTGNVSVHMVLAPASPSCAPHRDGGASN
jgi:serine/threonine-protein kinase